jgi:NADPH:quinone reductase-like Zn-dependent oxidoreductase
MRNTLGGGFAEFAIVKEDRLVKIPSGISFDQAATVPISGQAAMMGIELCQIKQGDKILINGASGGVGSFGVQIAKALGAYVTAICSTSKVNDVKSWGADEVIDYNVTSIKELGFNSYDAVFDTACFEKPNAYNSLLKEKGIYVLVGGDFYRMLKVKMFGKCYARKMQTFKSLTQDIEVNENIKKIFDMITQGNVTPSIKKVITLKEVPSAIDDLINRKVVGKIIVNNQG